MRFPILTRLICQFGFAASRRSTWNVHMPRLDLHHAQNFKKIRAWQNHMFLGKCSVTLATLEKYIISHVVTVPIKRPHLLRQVSIWGAVYLWFVLMPVVPRSTLYYGRITRRSSVLLLGLAPESPNMFPWNIMKQCIACRKTGYHVSCVRAPAHLTQQFQRIGLLKFHSAKSEIQRTPETSWRGKHSHVQIAPGWTIHPKNQLKQFRSHQKNILFPGKTSYH